MITADQLVAHAVGDYVLQSDWMATSKTKKSIAALAHVATYMLPFLLLTTSWKALAVIVGTHFIIDRWRLARYVVWAKNYLAPPRILRECPIAPEPMPGLVPSNAIVEGLLYKWTEQRNPPWRDVKDSFGYPKDRPVWLAMWLMVIADNIMHVIINGAALKWL